MVIGIVGILAALSYVGFQVVKDDNEAVSAEMTIGQMTRSALTEYIVKRDWTAALATGVAELGMDGESFVLRQDVATYAGVVHSDAYGIVSWRSNGSQLGVAMWNEGDGCSYARVDATRNIQTWTVSFAAVQECAGRYALQGPVDDIAGTTLVDPNIGQGGTAGLSVAANGTQITVSWTAVQGAATYNVSRDGKVIAQAVAATQYVDANLTPATLYSYSVTPLTAGAVQLATIGPNSQLTLPAQVQGLATQLRAKAVYVAWQRHSGQIEGYKLYRNGTEVYRGTQQSFLDETVTAGQSYTYTVLAYNAAGDGPVSTGVGS